MVSTLMLKVLLPWRRSLSDYLRDGIKDPAVGSLIMFDTLYFFDMTGVITYKARGSCDKQGRRILDIEAEKRGWYLL